MAAFPRPNVTKSASLLPPLPIQLITSPPPISLLLDMTFEQLAEVASPLPNDLGEFEELAAIECKISLLQDGEAAENPAHFPAASDTSLDSYRLVGVSAIENMINDLQCPACNGSDTSNQTRATKELKRSLLSSPECGDIAQALHSWTVNHSRQS